MGTSFTFRAGAVAGWAADLASTGLLNLRVPSRKPRNIIMAQCHWQHRQLAHQVPVEQG
jgi:hypothetical protein